MAPRVWFFPGEGTLRVRKVTDTGGTQMTDDTDHEDGQDAEDEAPREGAGEAGPGLKERARGSAVMLVIGKFLPRFSGGGGPHPSTPPAASLRINCAFGAVRWRGSSDLPKNPSTRLRLVPLPAKSRGGFLFAGMAAASFRGG